MLRSYPHIGLFGDLPLSGHLLGAQESLGSIKALSRDFVGFSKNAEITNLLKIAKMAAQQRVLRSLF